MCPQSQDPIEAQPSQLREQVLPVVAFDLGARLAAEQHELQGTSVGNVGRKVEKVFTAPPRAHGGGERIALSQEGGGQAERQRELQQAAAENRDESSKEPEQHMSGFVEDQIRQMQDRTDCGRTHRRRGKLPGPRRETDQQNPFAEER